MGYSLDGTSSDVMEVMETGRSVYLWNSLRRRSLFQLGRDKLTWPIQALVMEEMEEMETLPWKREFKSMNGEEVSDGFIPALLPLGIGIMSSSR
ncbi:uncharacterized protein EAF01_004433 [Botrytis porri]|uniref:uncharacterized protein n=1 Tax=Botrytis porri TaxID=87229 RepID=UPI0019026B2D|nr:uncharacterized protein EAF01_004433 [Botrytis porri]KAF7908678.1 hypothetical protein EAF01_004433 [Botrytis porri]